MDMDIQTDCYFVPVSTAFTVGFVDRSSVIFFLISYFA